MRFFFRCNNRFVLKASVILVFTALTISGIIWNAIWLNETDVISPLLKSSVSFLYGAVVSGCNAFSTFNVLRSIDERKS